MSKYAASVRKFIGTTKKLKQAQTEHEAAKQAFYKDMDEYFDRHKKDDAIDFKMPKRQTYVDGNLPTLRVKRVQPSKVEFNAALLAKVLGKRRAKKVIRKTYTIKNWAAFVELMKRFDVPVGEVKKLLQVDAKVDQKALEQLDAIGELDDVDSEDLIDCSTIINGTRYYKVTEVQNAY